MKGRRSNAAVDDLVAKGFSRAKCTQALKDAGNNTAVALRILEQQQKRQRDASAPQKGSAGQPTAATDGATAAPPPALATSIPSLLREPAKKATPTAAQASLQRQRARRHPCVVQYGSCQYGDHCVLRDFPGDVCVQHSQGSCVYGSACRHRHTVDGVDVRDVVRGARIGATYYTEDGGDGGEGDSGAAAGAAPSPPQHTDPFAEMHDAVSALPPSQHPAPFRDSVVAGPPSAPSQRVAATTILEAPPASRGVGRHPCVAQYGSCKYGDHCLHADRDADVCVHFLAGRCRFSAADCAYRHESAEEYQRSLRARAGLGEFAKPPAAAATAAAGTAAKRAKARLQGSAAPHTSASSASHSAAASALPSFEDVSALVAPEAPAEEPATDGAVADAETRVFLGLVEAYPAVEPAVVLQALRLCGNDPVAASDMMQHFAPSTSTWSSADVDDMAAALAVAAAEDAAEKEATAAAAQQGKSMERHNALLTLLMLFPGAEVAAVEAVLSKQRGDFAAAYGVLLCVQERVAQKALWQGSTATLTPADTLRVEKLCAMFPGLHHEIIRSAFCATQRDWSATTTALNELTKELLELETVEVPAGPVVWRPPPTHAAPQHQQYTRAVGAVPTVEESSAAAQAAYRAAEKEIVSYGDWRQVRQQAYLINDQRIRVLSQATAAFHSGDGRTAKLLSREGQRMAVEYNRLNRLAMLALEHERLRSDAMSTLDLHGFHTGEVHDVVVRRVAVCQRKRIGRLRIVVGEGLHSKRGHCSLYTTLMDELRTDVYLKAAAKVKSIKAGYVDVAVVFPNADD